MTTPQPVIKSALLASLAALVPAALGLLIAFGVDLTPEQQTAVLTFVAALTGGTGVVAPLIAARFAAQEVTPLAAPRDNAGNALVPAYRQAP